MQIVVNGEPRRVAEEMSVASLLQEFGLTPQRVAVEINERIAPRARFDETVLREGDRVEIVTLVGGG